MKKKPKPRPAPKVNAVADTFGPLIGQVRDLIQSARRAAAASVNTLQVLINFEIGRLIVEHEQQGEERAGYGREIMFRLASSLGAEFGRGFSETNLKLMRKFYLLWHDRAVSISQTSLVQGLPIRQKSSDELAPANRNQKPSDPLSPKPEIGPRKVEIPFNLSWSHYVVLLSIKNPEERSFYEIEAANSGWSQPELKRQVASCLYERLALSRDKKRVRELAEKGHIITQPADLLKEPYVLEFLGLDEKPGYSETDLESALIDKLQRFLLELGKGFLFEARQKRFTFDEDHFFVDLVFYNRLLRCYVLIDLKLDKLSHQDLGQMQMYVNFFDRHVRLSDENPTIGILLCQKKKDTIIELTLPKEANIFASQYGLYLPSKDDLRQRLMQWTAEEESRA